MKFDLDYRWRLVIAFAILIVMGSISFHLVLNHGNDRLHNLNCHIDLQIGNTIVLNCK